MQKDMSFRRDKRLNRWNIILWLERRSCNAQGIYINKVVKFVDTTLNFWDVDWTWSHIHMFTFGENRKKLIIYLQVVSRC